MKQLLLLQLRQQKELADDEYQSIIDAGLTNDMVRRVHMEYEGLPAIKLSDYSAVIVGGGPCNVSDKLEDQPEYQQLFEPKLLELLKQIVAEDFPYLGICYGMGVLTLCFKGVVSDRYSEPVGAVGIEITKNGEKDELLSGVPHTFKAFVGHKEAVDILPNEAVLLATSAACPVQLYRLGSNVYAVQFHPELTHSSLALRIKAYKDDGYFKPEEADSLIEESVRHQVEDSSKILQNFVRRYVF